MKWFLSLVITVEAVLGIVGWATSRDAPANIGKHAHLISTCNNHVTLINPLLWGRLSDTFNSNTLEHCNYTPQSAVYFTFWIPLLLMELVLCALVLIKGWKQRTAYKGPNHDASSILMRVVKGSTLYFISYGFFSQYFSRNTSTHHGTTACTPYMW